MSVHVVNDEAVAAARFQNVGRIAESDTCLDCRAIALKEREGVMEVRTAIHGGEDVTAIMADVGTLKDCQPLRMSGPIGGSFPGPSARSPRTRRS